MAVILAEDSVLSHCYPRSSRVSAQAPLGHIFKRDPDILLRISHAVVTCRRGKRGQSRGSHAQGVKALEERFASLTAAPPILHFSPLSLTTGTFRIMLTRPYTRSFRTCCVQNSALFLSLYHAPGDFADPDNGMQYAWLIGNMVPHRRAGRVVPMCLCDGVLK